MLPGGGFVILDTAVTPELAAEGLARDVVRAVQQARRDAGLDVSDRIELTLAADAEVRAAIEAHARVDQVRDPDRDFAPNARVATALRSSWAAVNRSSSG